MPLVQNASPPGLPWAHAPAIQKTNSFLAVLHSKDTSHEISQRHGWIQTLKQHDTTAFRDRVRIFKQMPCHTRTQYYIWPFHFAHLFDSDVVDCTTNRSISFHLPTLLIALHFGSQLVNGIMAKRSTWSWGWFSWQLFLYFRKNRRLVEAIAVHDNSKPS